MAKRFPQDFDPLDTVDLDTVLLGDNGENGTVTVQQIADTVGGDFLQSADIGVSIQAFSAVLAATTASFTTTLKNKLDAIAAGATANSADATLLARANHTGEQAISTITSLQTALDNKQAAAANLTDWAGVAVAAYYNAVQADAAIAAAIATLIGSAPGLLDTLDEIAAALNDDPDFAATMTTALAGKQPLATALTSLSSASANGVSLAQAANYAAMRGLLDLEAGTDFYSISAANAAFQPIAAALTSWAAITRASGFDTFVATPSSANLRALLSDEAGAGVAYFVGGDLGTPSAGIGTNLTSIPLSALLASTSLALGIGSLELGHATDTTLARLSAGLVGVEGKALAFREPTYNAQTGTSYTFALVDGGAMVSMSNASANLATIPANSVIPFPVNTVIQVLMLGAGITSIKGDTGVTLNGVSGGTGAIAARYSWASLTKIATDTWILSGNVGTVA